MIHMGAAANAPLFGCHLLLALGVNVRFGAS